MIASYRRVSVLALALLAGVASAQPEKKGQDIESPLIPVPTSEKTLSLAECLAIGANQQPQVRAAISSLRSTELGLEALNKLSPIAGAISPDLPYRKQQGEKGIAVCNADVQKTLEENKYDIIRMYYTFVYARQQDQTAGDIVTQLEIYYGVSKELAGQPGSKINKFTLYGMEEAIAEVKKLRITARTGESLSLAALKEAMGVDQTFDFIPRDTELPVMGGTVTQEQVLAFAMARRPEVAMATAGVDAFRLEVCAQGAVKYKQKVQTLAIGSDLHSRFIPGPHRNGDYRPGALSPEMPATLVGSREERVARACEILLRQEILFDKTRDLVKLEAINSFYQWQACTEKMRQAKARFEKGKSIADDAKSTLPTTKEYELLIRLQALAGKGQAEYIEAVYEHIKALATLERVTSGGVKPAFPDK
jgi:hypothetical protein